MDRHGCIAELEDLRQFVRKALLQEHLNLDIREVPLTAPTGLPAGLTEAYEAVAKALVLAAQMRASIPAGRPLFEEEARRLAGAFHSARDSYFTVEQQLQAVADADGCSHQKALNVICQVIDHCGHVLLGSKGFGQALAHIRCVPTFDLAKLLEAMRRQVSRAVGQAHQSDRGTTTNKVVETPPNLPKEANGPAGGCKLTWNGKAVDVPKGTVYRLLAFMWNREQATYDSLFEDDFGAGKDYTPVFGEPVTNETIRSRVSEVNGCLTKAGVPWKLSTDARGRFVTKSHQKSTGA